MLFTFAIAIFGLVAGSVTKVQQYIGCNTEYNGIMEIWQDVDSYMINIDTYFCSDLCPCQFTNTGPFESNSTISPYYYQWKKTNPGAIQFQNCSQSVKDKTVAEYNASHNDTIDADLFADYFAEIENKFNCTGFCKTDYVSTVTNTKMVMHKYMFTDVNRYY